MILIWILLISRAPCLLTDLVANLQVQLFGLKILNGKIQPSGVLLRENLSALIMSSRVTSSSIAIWRCSGSIELVRWLVVMPVQRKITCNTMLIDSLLCDDHRCLRTILQLWRQCSNVLQMEWLFEAENDFKFAEIPEYPLIPKGSKHLDYLKCRLI